MEPEYHYSKEDIKELMEKGKLNDEIIEEYLFHVIRLGYANDGFSEKGYNLLLELAKMGNKYAIEYFR